MIKGKGKLILAIILLAVIAMTAFACVGTNEIDYANVESITVDESSVAEGFLVSEFDISKVLLIVKYYDTVDALGATVPGQTVTMPATLNMVKAEDKAKLSVAGTHTITLIYRKFELPVTLVLRDSSVQTYRVTFLDENGNRLGDVQNVVSGGKAFQPALPTKQGYTFIGWRDRDNGNMTTFDNVTKDLVLEAVYAPDTYTVGYYSKTNAEEKLIKEVKVPRNGNALDYAPEIPVIQGYSNGRWENTEAMKNVNAEGLKFYAVYDADAVRVTFKYMRFGSAMSSHVITYAVGDEIKNPPEPSREGYKFVEWRVNGKKAEFPYKVSTEITFEAKYINVTDGNDGLRYTLTEGGLTVSGYYGEENVVVIPDKARESTSGELLSVVDISKGIFAGKNVNEFVVSKDNSYFVTIDGVLFNKNATALYAYPDMRTETAYSIPNSVVEIKPYAFYGAESLVQISLNGNLVKIGDYAFAECSGITSVTMPRNVEEIGEGAFSDNEGSAISSVSLEEAISLKTIKSRAFAGAVNLAEIALPGALEELGSAVFAGCKSLVGISALNNPYFKVINGGLYGTDGILYAYPALYGSESGAAYGITYSPEIEIDISCVKILTGAFDYTKISSVIIKSVVTIEEKAFNCPTLKRVYIDAPDVTLYSGSFGSFYPNVILNEHIGVAKQEEIRNLLKYGEVTVYDEATWEDARYFENNFIYETYIYDDEKNGRIEGIRILGSRQNFSNLNIPATLGNISVTAIGDYAFYGDNFIEKLYLPSNLKTIGERAFAYMEKLSEVTFNNIITEIGDYAFENSSLLTRVFSSAEMASVKSFGKGVFKGTPFLENSSDEFITVGTVLVKFTGFSADVVLPDFIKYVAADSFVGHGEITSITLGENVNIIDTMAFYRCNGIREINFPHSLTEIRNGAFTACADLFQVVFGANSADVSSTNGTKVYVDEEAFIYESGEQETDGLPVKVYSDTVGFEIIYYEDESGSTHAESGLSVIVPYSVDNRSTSIRFAGWYEDSEYTVPAVFPKKITEATNFYSRWVSTSSGSSGIIYRSTDDGTAYAVSGYIGSDTYVIVPSNYMGKPVREIADGAFKNTNVVNIELPNTKNSDTGIVSSTITSIGEDAFLGTPWYENYCGDFVTIDDFLIRYNGENKIVSVSDKVKKIARGAFKGNVNMEEIVIPNSVTELADAVFEGCTALKKVSLPSGLLVIGNSTFNGCEQLADIDFSVCSGLGTVGSDSFDGTAWLKNYVDPCVMINNILYKYNGSDDENILHIYNGVTAIGESAFEGNDTLKRVYIPQSVTIIGKRAFADSHIAEVNLYAGGSRLTLIQDEAFAGAESLSVIDLSLASLLGYIGERAFYGCYGLKKIEIPSATIDIGNYAFSESGLVNVSFLTGSKLKKINVGTFASCRSLYNVDFGVSALTEIGDRAFEYCTALTYFDNAEGRVVSIGYRAFYGCENLSRFLINENTLAEIGEEALESVGSNIGEKGFVVLGNILIGYDGNETVVEIPDNITTIYNGAFMGNSRIKKIIFGANSAISNVNSKAFYDCVNLEEINFPDGIRFVGDDVVTGTKWYNALVRDGEEFIVIARTLIKYNGTTPKRVVIPDSVQVINKNAFSGSTVFDIVIGENVTTIERGAFDGINLSAFENWTLTITGDVPPVIKEIEPISAQYVLIPEKENVSDDMLIDVYRLDENWKVQYDAGKIKIAKKFTVEYVVNPEEGIPVDSEKMYAFYEEKYVEPIVSDSKSFTFIGWYIDEEKKNSVQFPFIPENILLDELKNILNEIFNSDFSSVMKEGLSPEIVLKEGITFDDAFKLELKNSLYDVLSAALCDVLEKGTELSYLLGKELSAILKEEHSVATVLQDNLGYRYRERLRNRLKVYAKFIDNAVGSNGEDFQMAAANADNSEKTIELYLGDSDNKIVVISSHAGVPITSVTGGWIRDVENGTHSFVNGEYIADPTNGNYRFSGAFEGHAELNEVYFALNSKIAVIGKNAFRDCVNLTKIILPPSVVEIEAGAFENCLSLTEIVFTGDCTGLKIRSGAFKNCKSLEKITLPAGIATIENNAFENCNKLKDIYALAEIAIPITRDPEELPFEIINGLRIHIKPSAISSYSATWEAYADYLVTDIEENTVKEEE